MRLSNASGRPVVIALLFGLTTILAGQSHAQLETIKAGVAKIVVTAPASKVGTGIVVLVRRDVNDAYIVTAAHVVSDAEKFFVQFHGDARKWSAQVKHIERENIAQGLALLRVLEPLPAGVQALPLDAGVRLTGGEEVTMIGHQASTGDWGVLSGNVSGRKGREIVIQAPIQEQTSGGPVILGNRLVGLVQRNDPPAPFGYAVTALAIREYVEGLGVQIVATPAPPQTRKDKPPQPPPPSRTISKSEGLRADFCAVLTRLFESSSRDFNDMKGTSTKDSVTTYWALLDGSNDIAGLGRTALVKDYRVRNTTVYVAEFGEQPDEAAARKLWRQVATSVARCTNEERTYTEGQFCLRTQYRKSMWDTPATFLTHLGAGSNVDLIVYQGYNYPVMGASKFCNLSRPYVPNYYWQGR